MTAPDLPLTSVIMVTYRTGPMLFEAINSVMAQTAPVELLLVDNGNPPDVLAKLHDIAGTDKRIRLILRHGNIGFSKGCNLGARSAQGEYFLFLNPDSNLPADTVEKLIEKGSQLKRPYMIGARLVDREGRDQRGCRRAILTPSTAFVEALHLGGLFPHLRLNKHEEPPPDRLSQMPAISGAFMFMHREDFWNIGGFDEDYFLHVDDLDLCLRFRRAGGEIWFAPDLVVTHYGSTSEATSTFIECNKASGFIRYFHKNYKKEYPAPFLWLLDLAILGRAGVRIVMPKFGNKNKAA